MLYPIKRNKKFGFIDDNGNVIIEPELFNIGKFSNDVCAVYKEIPEVSLVYNNETYYHSEMSLIDTKGNTLNPFVKYLSHICFFEEKAFAYHNKLKKWGVINKKGETIIPFVFDDFLYSNQSLIL